MNPDKKDSTSWMAIFGHSNSRPRKLEREMQPIPRIGVIVEEDKFDDIVYPLVPSESISEEAPLITAALVKAALALRRHKK